MIDLQSQWQQILPMIALLMSRMAIAFSVIPIFMGNSIPAFIRVAFVAGLSMALLPVALQDPATTSLPLTSLLLYTGKEALIGLVLGLIASVAFWALYVAGTIIEYQAGLSFATTIDPMSGQEDSLVGTLFQRMFTALFLITGGLLSLIGMLFDSYRVWPLASLQPLASNLAIVQLLITTVLNLVIIAVKVAAPFVIIMLLLEVAVGYLSRFAPQLNVFFVTLPLKVLSLAFLLLAYGAIIAANGDWLPMMRFDTVLAPLERATP
jgi:type III secretion protein T